MPTLQAADIADLVVSTQRDLGRMRWTEIATDLQEHVAMNQLLRKERVGFGSGYEISFTVQLRHSDAAQNVGLFEVDNVNVSDVLTTATVPWRHTVTSYAIERREIAMNRDPARIVELVRVRRADAMIALAARYEADFWNEASEGSGPPSDNKTIFGATYWIAIRTTSDGFTGQNPTNFTAVAGIDSSLAANSRWRSYAFQYTNVTKQDLVRKWREAATKCLFMPPAAPTPTFNTGDRYGFYTNYAVIGPLEEALEGQNENLGNDVASRDGKLLFRQVPVTWVPQLDSTTTFPGQNNPVFGINWGVFKPVFLSGEYMREQGPEPGSNQHNVFRTFVDNTVNFVCYDRRRCFRGETD